MSVISLHWSTWSKNRIKKSNTRCPSWKQKGHMQHTQGKWAAKLTELHPCLAPSNLAAPQLTLHYSAVHQYHLPLHFPAVTLPVLIAFCILIHSVILDLLALHLIICVTVSFSGASFYIKAYHLKIYFKKHFWNTEIYCVAFRH